MIYVFRKVQGVSGMKYIEFGTGWWNYIPGLIHVLRHKLKGLM